VKNRLAAIAAAFAFALLGTPVAFAQSAGSCVGTGLPDIADGAFDCASSDIVPGTGESGNFLYVRNTSSGTVTIDSITVDFGPSLDADFVTVISGAHNLAGVTMTNANLAGNVFTANFSGFTNAVDPFYLFFNFDKRSLATGTPLGADYQGATISLSMSDGTVLNGSYTQVDFFVAGAYLGVGGGAIDAWIRDCDADDGTVPSTPNCPTFWRSPDIFLDTATPGAGSGSLPSGDLVIDGPMYGVRNRLKAFVRNRGTGFAENVQVSFYFRNNHTGLAFANGATLIGQTSVNVPANAEVLTGVDWTIPNPPNAGHWCIGVVLEHPDDPQTSTHPPDDNNVACVNIGVIAGRAGDTVTVDFDVGAAGQKGFGLTAWPHEFIVTVSAETLRGWTWKIEGLKADEKFRIDRGESRKVRLLVDIPESAKPHESVEFFIRQLDADTRTAVGGVVYQIYEDHLPPRRIRALNAVLADGKPRLTWERVRVESKSGATERIARYEVLRDGERVAEVIRDEDLLCAGIQWTDPEPGSGRVAYTVRAVDHGGNVGEPSEEAVLVLGAGGEAAGDGFDWKWIAIAVLAVLLLLRLRRS